MRHPVLATLCVCGVIPQRSGDNATSTRPQHSPDQFQDYIGGGIGLRS